MMYSLSVSQGEQPAAKDALPLFAEPRGHAIVPDEVV